MPNDFSHDYYAWALSSIDQGQTTSINYSTVSVDDVINGFMISYVGEDKVIRKANRTEVAFFAQRGIQELSYDVLPSQNAIEFLVPNSLVWQLPKDYVNYVKIFSYNDNGLERVIYPERKSGDPFSIKQEANGQPDFDFGTRNNPDAGPDGVRDGFRFSQNSTTVVACTLVSIPGVTSRTSPIYRLRDFTKGAVSDLTLGLDLLLNRDNINPLYNNGFSGQAGIVNINKDSSNLNATRPIVTLNKYIGGEGPDAIQDTVEFVVYESEMWKKFKGNSGNNSNVTYDPTVDNDLMDVYGRRYGLEPERVQVNGTFYVNDRKNRIHFSSGLAGQHVTIEYISDGMASGYDARVHKFSEEALYKHIQYELASARSYVPQGVKLMLKKEARASKRNAKLRLANYKMEEWAQLLRNKNKHIKN